MRGDAILKPHHHRRPHPPRRLVPLVAPCLLLLTLFMTGCPAQRSMPTTAPVPAPVSRTVQTEAEVRALAEARAHFDAGRYGVAVRLLRHFLELHTHSPTIPEARWLLGRSYEELGEWHAALAQYRLVAAEATRPPGLSPAMNTQVRDRLSLLTRRLGRAAPGTAGSVAIWLDPSAIPEPGLRAQWLSTFIAEGVTTLVFDVGPLGPGDAPGTNHERPGAQTAHGVYFRTTWASLKRDLFGEMLPLARDLGITIFASMDITNIPWLDPTLGWTTYVYDDQTRQIVPSMAFDPLHPAIQEYLTGLLTDLVRLQIDGLFLRIGERTGPRYHVSGRGLDQFGAQLPANLDPKALLIVGRSLPLSTPGSSSASQTNPSAPSDQATIFWRWAGWQARQRLAMLLALRSSLRRYQSGLQVVLALHDTAVTKPLDALIEHGEDLLETTTHGLPVAIPFPPSRTILTSADPDEGWRFEYLSRLVNMIGSPERIWILVPVAAPDRASVVRELHTSVVEFARTRGLNILFVPQPARGR